MNIPAATRERGPGSRRTAATAKGRVLALETGRDAEGPERAGLRGPGPARGRARRDGVGERERRGQGAGAATAR